MTLLVIINKAGDNAIYTLDDSSNTSVTEDFQQ